jgi:hypothetical protein
VPAKARRYRPIGLLGDWLQSIVLGAVVVNLALVVVAPGSVFIEGRLRVSSTALEGLLIADAAVLALVALSSLLWCYRVTANLSALGARGVPHSPASAVYWWFVPFMSLVRPFQVLSVVSQASDPGYEPGTARWESVPRYRHLQRWWAAFLGGSVGSRVIFGVWGGGDGGSLDTAFAVAAGVASLGLVLWFLVVRSITTGQRQRAVRLARRGWGPEWLADHART